MTKHLLLFLILVLLPCSIFAQWHPVGDKIKTQWSEQIDPANVLPEYPRPIMERSEWLNLNGLWDYALTSLNQFPENYQGKILVPFAVESSLSGVGKQLGEKNNLWYKRSFTVPAKWRDKKIVLHFGAVDWKADVWVNGIKVGQHTGGFTPFSFDMTAALKKGVNKLVVKVWDSTDKGMQPRGKQVSEPNGIWYTPVSGIWQTVWMEPVPTHYIKKIKTTPNIDENSLRLQVDLNKQMDTDRIAVEVFDGENIVAHSASINHGIVEVRMPEKVKLWSPKSPFLYDLRISLYSEGKLCDVVKSYAGMRKFSTHRDANGIVRLQLNNKDLFQFGPLDQGWWPDGLYTAPTDEALCYDLKKIKDFGYNMVRKHVKVEPARWYTHCDRLGLIVWQDMPSGDMKKGPEWQNHQYFEGTELIRSASSEQNFRKEWKEIIDYLYAYPSIGVWVPFNEAWGQFKTAEITKWTKDYDSSRLVNPASGGNFYTCGDMLDLHNYPGPKMYLFDALRCNVLGEYGGIGYVVKDHLWEPKRNWGYVQFNSSEEVTDRYILYAKELLKLIDKGFSAAVYTQITDVEIEINGLMTYDRKVIKVNEKSIREMNQSICESLSK